MENYLNATNDSLNDRDLTKTADYVDSSPVIKKTEKVDRSRSSLSRSLNFSDVKARVSTNVDARGRVYKSKLTQSPSKTDSFRYYVQQDTHASSCRKMDRIQSIQSVSANQAQSQINLRY